MVHELLVAGALALATLRRYSVAQTVALTSLALLLSSGLSSVACAPVYGSPPAVSTHGTMERWQQPCGEPVAAPNSQMSRRHNVHRTLKRVRTQLKVAQNHLRMHLKDVHEIYSNVVMLKGQYRMTLLPQHEFEWYYREVWCLEKSKKAERALPHLFESLRTYATYFDKLERFDYKSPIEYSDTLPRRNEIISEMKTELIRVLCEVETAILNLNHSIPKKVAKVPDLVETGDQTAMLIQDWGVIRLYQSFLNAWTKAFRNATQPGPGTCDPNRPNFVSKNVGKRPNAKGKRVQKIKKQRRPIRKHQQVAENGSTVPGPRKQAARNRLMRNRQKKPVGI